jgi:hypothetical protein
MTGPAERTTDASVGAAVRPSPSDPLFTITEGPQEPPEGLPEGYNWRTTITVDADAGWLDNYSVAYGQSVVNYAGTNAIAEVTLHVLEGSTSLSSVTQKAEADDAWPATRGLTASATLPGDSNKCGLYSYASAHGAVWNKWFLNSSWTTWGKKTAGDSDQKAGPACPPPPPGDGGGGGGGGDGGGGGGDGEEWRGDAVSEPGSGGTEVCYYTHWYVSHDGGNTWRWESTEFHGCYDAE